MSLCEHASLRQLRYCRGKRNKNDQLVLLQQLPRRAASGAEGGQALPIAHASMHSVLVRNIYVLIQWMRRGCIGP